MKSIRFLVVAATVSAVAFAGSVLGQPIGDPYPLKAALNSMQVVPVNGSTARATCKITEQEWVESDQGPYPIYAPVFEAVCDFWGLTGPLIDVDIRSARNGQNGGGFCQSEKRARVTLPNTGSGTATIYCKGNTEPHPPFHFKREYIVLQTALYPDGEIRGQIRPLGYDPDVDGEGRAEVSVFRPSDGLAYSFSDIGNKMIVAPLTALGWNAATDSVPFLSDFDGDGIADWAFTRTLGSGSLNTLWLSRRGDYPGGCWYGNTNLGDVYAYGDYEGNGATECAVFRTSTGVWWIDQHNTTRITWGGPGAATTCPGDYDADGKTDPCLIRPDGAQLVWSIRKSLGGEATIRWGLTTDEVFPTMPADFDGDGASDLYISRAENGRRYFWILKSSTGELDVRQWGLATDTVKVADYERDGISDIAAIRDPDGRLVWYIKQSSDGLLHVDHWGLSGDK